MLQIAAIPFWSATAAYLAGAYMAMRYMKEGDPRFLVHGKRFAAAGNSLLLFVFVLRWVQWGLIPFTGLADSLSLFLIFSTGIVLMIQRDDAMRPLLSFYLPALAALSILSAATGYRFLGDPPRELNGLLLIVHVGLVFLAMAHFFVASTTSIVYAFQARRLKHHKTAGPFQRLPSLEHLDRTLFRLIQTGLPLFVVTLALGFVWEYTRLDHDPQWWLKPKILFSVLLVALFGAAFVIRRAGLLRGPKLAYLLFFGFTSLLLLWIGLEITNHAIATPPGTLS